MTSTIQALQSLYVAMGGKLTDTYASIDDGAPVSNLVRIPDMLNAIVQLKLGKGSELPAVTAADNDKVLTVVNGSWDKAENRGGGNSIILINESTSGDYKVLDKNYAEIATALANGSFAFVRRMSDLGVWIDPVISAQLVGNQFEVTVMSGSNQITYSATNANDPLRYYDGD